ncbi:type III secretion system export apparatus subunit SctT [Burkholderia ubonensis]|uniref:type III secretion system export apparatus subunit SctT n=1 Tax=Burkholderia ubonensis TaxID=101571 RepID=UPI000B091CEA|nr:type III secretion system export apparatus subunit SctT [Burkholderia ubonensis]
MAMSAAQIPFDWAAAAVLGSARLIGCINFIPAFGRQNMTMLIRNASALAIGLPFVFAIHERIEGTMVGTTWLGWLALKEGVIGCLIGLLLATPFWAFMSVGVLIDNQRGANAAQQINPTLPADSSVLGEMIERVLILVLVEAGVFPVLFTVIGDSFTVWPVLQLVPNVEGPHLSAYLAAFQRMLVAGLQYSSPILVLLLLLEFVFALASVIVKGMPVHEMAMPIKSLLSLFVLALYATTLFDYGAREFAEWLPWLRHMVIAR